jgi:acetyl-CoA carboxylase biotin carboxyl carrier protein
MALPRRTLPKPPADVLDLVRQLGGVLAELGLSELELTWGEVRIRLQRPVPGAPAGGAASATTPATPERLVVAEVSPVSFVTVEAPMVGTFYRASSPTADPYVGEGDVVKQGQILCIIEAMKLMNEIESKVSGRIAKILVENGQPVEYGHPLFLIDPQP